MDENKRKHGKLATGFSDKLQPLEALDLSKVKTADDLVRGMGKCAFGARNVGEAADVLEAMVRDKSCYKVLTLSGAMTVAKMGLVICDMIDNGMVDAVISTGALMAHGFVESVGMRHFKFDWGMQDEELYEKGYDRVYDTLELEKNLDDVETIVNEVLGKVDSEVLCSHRINRMLGEYLVKKTKGRGVLRSACERNVPVYVPAFTDSEIGLDMALHNVRRKEAGRPQLAFNPFLDLEDFAGHIRAAKKIGIFTIGGGVPRNWAQQIGPLGEILDRRTGGKHGGFIRFHYAIRICPEPVHWGGLSGCTYSEGVSWGKFVSEKEGGRHAEVYADATIAWPLLLRGVLERMGRV